MSDRASRAIAPGERVCVTGASGYVGSHVVGELLSRGYRVRGTVRDPGDETKTAHLRALAAGDPEALQIVAADLFDPDSLDAAIADCPYVCHVAASVILRSDDPQRKIVDVAVEGTKNVLRSIDRAGVARRVAMTSSIAAIVDDTKPLDFVHDERCWNESSTLADSPYPLAKTRAERAAYDHHASLDEADRYGLVTLNPTLVLGPVMSTAHRRSSPVMIRDLIAGKYPLVPKFHFGIVDVRDVAIAHVNALERPDAAGRHLLCSRGAWLPELAAIAREAFPDHKTPRFAMPNLLTYVAAVFDKRLSFSLLRRNLGVVRRLDNRKSREALGMQYRDVADTVRDTGRSFIELGLA